MYYYFSDRIVLSYSFYGHFYIILNYSIFKAKFVNTIIIL